MYESSPSLVTGERSRSAYSRPAIVDYGALHRVTHGPITAITLDGQSGSAGNNSAMT